MLSRNTTWTLQRDTDLGLNFTAVVYYDGQGFMVAKKLGVKSAKELNGADDLRAAGNDHRTQPRRLLPRQQDRFQAGGHREARRGRERVLLRPLRCLYDRPLRACGDPRGASVRTPTTTSSCRRSSRRSRCRRRCARATTNGTTSCVWVIFALVQGRGKRDHLEERRRHAEIGRSRHQAACSASLRGSGKSLGIDDKWAYNEIKLVGNYGEIFERNVGQGSPLKLAARAQQSVDQGRADLCACRSAELRRGGNR